MGHAMKATTPYQERAARCREMAAQAKSDEDRELLLKIADTWDWISTDTEPTETAEPERAPGPAKPHKSKQDRAG